MKVKDIIKKLSVLDGELEVVVRGENVVAYIADVYLDHDHTDDSPFASIDLENEI